MQERTLPIASSSVASLEPESAPTEEFAYSDWKPEGSMFPPEVFRELLLLRRLGPLPEPETPSYAANISVATDASKVVADRTTTSITVNRSADSPDKSTTPAAVAVPTIMLSNSTAAVSLSLESSQNIAPLAMRRGRKAPAPLELSPATLSADDLYPGIPTPFLGSPSTYTPTFEFNQESSDASMNLLAMCQDLRSRCPPLHPPSPPQNERSAPFELLPDSDSSSSNHSSDANSDDWAFAHDILAQHEDLQREAFGSPGSPPTTVSDSPAAKGDGCDSYSWNSARTLTNTSPKGVDSEPCTPDRTSKSSTTQQRRRRTVIIETRDSALDNVKPARMTVDLSHLAENHDDTPISRNFDTSLPVEVSAALDSFAQSTPYSRPVSNATLRMPIRSILKSREKKRVRFSMMPGDEEGEGDMSDVDAELQSGRKRAATTPTCRRDKHRSSLQCTAEEAASFRASFPKHPVVKTFSRRSTIASQVDTTPTPSSRKPRQSLPLAPRVVDKTEVGPPKRLSARKSMSAVPAKKQSKKAVNDENEDVKKRRFSEGGANAQKAAPQKEKTSTSPKSRMPFRSILTKFRV